MNERKREFLKAGAGVAAIAALPSALAQTPTGWQPSGRYPDPTVNVVGPSFNRYRLGLAKVERIASNCRVTSRITVGTPMTGAMSCQSLNMREQNGPGAA